MRDIIDAATGDVLFHAEYDAFGAATEYGAGYGDTLKYTAREFDADTGLQYNRARWYDNSTGRWLSEDPIGFAAGDRNLYRYVSNFSTGATDPSGLDIFITEGAGFEAGAPNSASAYFHFNIHLDLWENKDGRLVPKMNVDTQSRQLYWYQGMGPAVVGIKPFWNNSRNRNLYLISTVFVSSPFFTVVDVWWGVVQSGLDKDVINTAGREVRRLKTTPEQDIKIKKVLDERVSDKATYSIQYNNCRKWAWAILDDIEKAINDARTIRTRTAEDIMNEHQVIFKK